MLIWTFWVCRDNNHKHGMLEQYFHGAKVLNQMFSPYLLFLLWNFSLVYFAIFISHVIFTYDCIFCSQSVYFVGAESGNEIRDLHVKYLGVPLTRLKSIDCKAFCDQIFIKMKTWRARSLRSRLQLVTFVLYSVQKP